ncbi:MAG: DUF3667 domain-containing protein [Pseudomonadota bacterium]
MKTIRATVCQNCGTALIGEHCHMCGQSAYEPRRAVIGLVQDFFVDTLAIDGKLFRTIWLLLTRPGRLARRFLDGQRVRYSPPFRLYLFASVFFFLAVFDFNVLGWMRPGAPDDDAPPAVRAQLTVDGEDGDVTLLSNRPEKPADEPEDVSPSDDDSAVVAEDIQDTPWEKVDYDGPDWLEPYAKQMYEAGQSAFDDPRLFLAQTKENLPRALLFAPVFYALLLLLLYVYRRRFFVYDHFVVSLYMHAALYAYLIIAILISKIPGVGVLFVVPLVWGWFQPFVVFRQAYGSGWVSAFLKWVLSIGLYYLGLVAIVTLGLSYTLYNS